MYVGYLLSSNLGQETHESRQGQGGETSDEAFCAPANNVVGTTTGRVTIGGDQR